MASVRSEQVRSEFCWIESTVPFAQWYSANVVILEATVRLLLANLSLLFFCSRFCNTQNKTDFYFNKQMTLVAGEKDE